MTKSKTLSKLIAYIVISAILVGSVSPVYAQTDITIDGVGSGSDTWVSGYASTSDLYTTDGENYRYYTDWVQSPLDDTVTMTGGTLITNGLTQNGKLNANGGSITVQSGRLSIASGSNIYSGANLTLNAGATLYQTGGNVYINSGDSINVGTITANGGNLTFSGGTHTITSGSSISNSLSVEQGATVNVSSANSLHSNFGNAGTLNFNGGTKSVVITGNGTTNFHGNNTNNANLTQNRVTNDGNLTNNATITANLTNSNTINGSGSIVTGTGTSSNSGSISQYDLTNNGTFTNTGTINLANKLTNNSSSTFTTNASSISATNGISNAGTLNFTGGTNSNVVTGNGTTNITGDLLNENSISQYDINVAEGKLVTTNASDLTASHIVTNDGIINYTGGATGNTINGNGRLIITGYVTNTGNINQSQVNNSSVFINNGNVTANLVNTGSLEGTGNYVTKTGASSNSGTIAQNNLTNNGTFDNNGHIDLTGTLTNNGTFNTNASLLTANGGAVNAGTLNLTEGTNAVTITGAGTTNFSGTTTNNANVTQSTVTNDGVLTNNYTITGNMTNTGNITGTGSIITGTGTSSSNGTITQTNLTNNGTFNSNDKITLTGVLNNNGTFNNNAMLSAAVNNALGSTLNSNPDNLGGNVANNGSLNLNADGTLSAAVTGTGTTVFNGNITNEAEITQDIVTISDNYTLNNNNTITADVTNNGTLNNAAVITGDTINSGTINTLADNLVGTVNNAGTLNIAGGKTAATISGSGSTNITADLIVDHNINQGSITNSAALTNNAVITSNDIVNSGTITGAASGLVGNVNNTGTLAFNSASTGNAVISGTGDVQVTANTTLSGANTYTGDTLIKGATLTIAGQNNISTDSDILFANNGILRVTTAGTLSNLLKGQTATDNVGVQNDAALTLNTAIGEANNFHKYGNGVMTLGMASNNYTGNTYVHAGTLIGNTANINNTVIGAAGSTVEFTDNTDANLNKIDSDGTFVYSGSAVLNVETNGFMAAQTKLDNGTFAVNRVINTDILNVNNNATLRGVGRINGFSGTNSTVNINNGATLAPGNSIGTLTVTGNVNFNNGSTTAIEINETSSDQIVISGNANIQSGANLTVTNEDGRFFEWQEFELVNASNVNGEFAYDGTIANFDTSRIDVALDYSDPNKVTLTAKRKATDYEDVEGLSDNQQEVAQAIDAVSTGFGGDITNALLQLEALGGLNPDDVTLINNSATLQSALDNLSGVIYANSTLVPLFNAKTAHVYDRITKQNALGKVNTNHHDSLWAEYYGQHDNVFKTSNSSSFTNNMTGVLVGYDRLFDDVLLGAYIGGGKSNLRQNHDKMDIDDFSLGIYAGYQPGNWVFKGTLLGGYQTYNGKRNIDFIARTAKSSYHGFNFALDLEAGYNVYTNDWFNVKPFVGVLGNYTQTRSFTETGADSLNLRVKSKNLSTAQARLGVQVDGTIEQKLSWYGSAAVKRYLTHDYSKLQVSFVQPGALNMNIMSAKLGYAYFSGQLGLNYAFTNQWSVFGNTEFGINDRALNCYGNIGVAYSW